MGSAHPSKSIKDFFRRKPMGLGFASGTLICSLVLLFVSGCTTDYHPFPQPKVVMGSGGEKSSFHGIDLWTAGLPPRKFEVIGSIIDNRPSGALAMCLRSFQIAALAKQKGGDAMILEYDRAETQWNGITGGQQNPIRSNTVADIAGSPIHRGITKYYVIKYLLGEPM
jgi:hypothetical protein